MSISLEEQKQVLKEKSTKEVVSKELKKEIYSYWAGVLTLIVSIAAIVIAFFGIISVEKSDILTLKSFSAVIIASSFTAIIFIWFSNRMINRIAKNLSETKIKYADALDTFIILRKEHEEKIILLDEQIKQNERISKNISNSPISHLVSWEQSEEYEKRSEFVYGITYDLSWINFRIDTILQEVSVNRNHKYFLLLIESNRITKTNERNIREKIMSAEETKELTILDENIFIRNIQDLSPCPVTRDFPLPLPNDIAIYKNISFGNKRRVAVMSPQGVHNTLENNHQALEHGYDIQFTVDEQIDKVEFWFENIWERITGSKPQ